MAGNTIMTAKNSFLEGLVMDFAPDNTQANVLTSALNATLLTFNGNEMSLLNDMGNGRVETAHLPEGYIPVGTCEFGDIIYIVSYNPLTDKAQIGCFPSPERNISSEENNNDINVSLSANDFQELNENGEPTGDLKTSSVKKILFQNDLHPGDKYVIYAKDVNKDEVKKTLSEHGNSDQIMGKFPKFLKVRIVSIEESGKITYIDSNVKWYNNDYYIQEGKSDNVILKPDLDSYRSLVNSAYNTFASKVSGKLALLIELEKITGFSHSWEVYETKSNDKDITYNVYFNFSWTTDSIYINPSKICITDSYWNKTDSPNKFYYYNRGERQTQTLELNFCNEIEITRLYKPEEKVYSHEDVNNIYSNIDVKPIVQAYEETTSEKTTYYLPNCGTYSYVENNNKFEKTDDVINNFYNYPITKLFWENLTIPSKRNGLDVNLTDAVYNYEITPAMPYGLLREFSQKGQIDFSKIGKENIKLHTWKYYNTSDTCTLTWGMDAYTSPGKIVSSVEFKFYDHDHGHVATLISDNKRSYNGIFTDYFSFNVYGSHPKLKLIDFKTDGKTENYPIKNNDLYLVEINIYQSFKHADGSLIKIETPTHKEYRWFWTNDVFNSYYNQVIDFNELNLVLDLECNANFKSNEYWKMTTKKDQISIDDLMLDYNLNNIKTNKQIIDGSLPNIDMKINVNLIDTYNTFSLDLNELFDILIMLGNEFIENVPEQPKFIQTEETGINPEIYCNNSTIKEENANYMHLFGNSFNLCDQNYINSDGIQHKATLEKTYNNINISLLENDPIKLNFEAIHNSKYYCVCDLKNEYNYILKPVVHTIQDLNSQGININENEAYFDKLYYNSIDNELDNRQRVVFTWTIASINPIRKATEEEQLLFLKELGGIDFIQMDDTRYTYITGIDKQGYKICTSEDQPYYKLYRDSSKDALSETYPLFIPYLIGYNENQLKEYIKNSGDHEGNWEKYRNKIFDINDVIFLNVSVSLDTQLSSGYTVDKEDLRKWLIENESELIANLFLDMFYMIITTSRLAGTLAILDDSGQIIVFSDWDKNIVVNGANKVSSLLMNLYYKSNETESELVKYIKDLIYLSDNYTLYTRDIILNVASNKENINININNEAISLYSNTIISKSKLNNININNSNITVLTNTAQTVLPLLFKIPYIIPEVQLLLHTNKLRIKSVLNEFDNKYTTDSANLDELYSLYYDEHGNIKLNSLYNTQQLPILTDYKVEHNICKCNITNNMIDLNDYLKSRLSIKNGKVVLSTGISQPITSDKYKIHMCNLSESGSVSEDKIHISEFPNNYSLL